MPFEIRHCPDDHSNRTRSRKPLRWIKAFTIGRILWRSVGNTTFGSMG